MSLVHHSRVVHPRVVHPRRSFAAAVAVATAAAALLAALPARADIWSTTTLTSSGTSINGTPITGLATLTFSGTTLTVQVSNSSTAPSAYRSDILTSFYFDIVKSGSIRPALTYVSGSGYAWQVYTAAADVPVNYSPPMPGGLVPSGTGPHLPANLVATNTNDDTWQFRSWTLGTAQWDVTKFPQTGFGIGTVGNSGTTSGTFFNKFNGSIVDGINFGIYRADGDLTAPSNSLNGLVLVRNTATFTFTSPDLMNFSCTDVQPYHVFGFGTDPETILTPEPGSIALLASALAGAAAWASRRRRGQRAAP
ncbi:MAG: XDD4 family exosortase-dependent surface protein [Pirellulales bacterium]